MGRERASCTEKPRETKRAICVKKTTTLKRAKGNKKPSIYERLYLTKIGANYDGEAMRILSALWAALVARFCPSLFDGMGRPIEGRDELRMKYHLKGRS